MEVGNKQKGEESYTEAQGSYTARERANHGEQAVGWRKCTWNWRKAPVPWLFSNCARGLCLFLQSSPSGFAHAQGPSYTFLFRNLPSSQDIILQNFALVFLLCPQTRERTHQIAEPMKLRAGELNICVPPKTPTGF